MTGRQLLILVLAAALPLLLMRWTRADDAAPAKAPDRAAADDRAAPAPNPAPPRDAQAPREGDTRGPRDDQGPRTRAARATTRVGPTGGRRVRRGAANGPLALPAAASVAGLTTAVARPISAVRTVRARSRFALAARIRLERRDSHRACRAAPTRCISSRDPGAMERGDPEMFKLFQQEAELDRETRQLAGEFREAPTDKKDEVKKKLQETVAKHFEVRQQRRAMELKRLETELTRLRDSIEKRNQEKQQIIDRRVSELLGQEDNQF